MSNSYGWLTLDIIKINCAKISAATEPKILIVKAQHEFSASIGALPIGVVAVKLTQ